MPLQITITDAGRAEVINANNTGTGPVTIAEIGLGTGQYEPAPEQTALTAETKRLATIAGQVVSADTIHVTIKDETGDAYTVNEIGLYTDSGTLFAVYSDPVNPIAQKAAASSLLLAVDIVLGTLDANSLTFGDTSFAMPPASETVPGIVRMSDEVQALAGEDEETAMSPKRVFQAFQQFGLGAENPPDISDLNSATKPGFYKYIGVASNSPSASGGMLLVLSQNASRQAQIATEVATGNIHYRWRSDLVSSGAWSTWEQISRASNTIGMGQSWQRVDSSRLAGVTYTNTTGRPIMIAITQNQEGVITTVFIDNVAVGVLADDAGPDRANASFIVPDGSTYRFEQANGSTNLIWAELR